MNRCLMDRRKSCIRVAVIPCTSFVVMHPLLLDQEDSDTRNVAYCSAPKLHYECAHQLASTERWNQWSTESFRESAALAESKRKKVAKADSPRHRMMTFLATGNGLVHT